MKIVLVTLVLTVLLVAHTNAQQGWLLQTNPLGPQGSPTPPLGKVQFVSSTTGWITVDNGKLLHTTNGGETWTIVTPGGSDTVDFSNNPGIGLSFISQSTGWVIGVLGGFNNAQGAVVYKTTNGGGTWSRQILSSWTYGFGIHFVDAHNGWANVFNGPFPTNVSSAIIHTTDGGNTWSTQFAATGKVAITSFTDSSTGLAFTDSLSSAQKLICPCEILNTTNGGSTWNTRFTDNTPGGFEDIQLVDDNNGWIVGDSAKILQTMNSGMNWTSITNAGIASSSKNRAVFFLDANNGWIGSGVSGGVNHVLHTTNGGTSWDMQSVPVQYSIFSIYFTDVNNGWLSADFGGIARTTSGGELTSVQEDYQSIIPTQFQLGQNYPNPFNPATMIKFSLPGPSIVTLKIYNALGQEVVTLLNYEEMTGGTHEVQVNASNLTSGVYFYRLAAHELINGEKGTGGKSFMSVKKMVLLK